MSADKLADQAESIAAAVSGVIRGALIGQPPEVQGAILADLTATWLAGHQGPSAEDLRAELLAMHIGIVLDLVPINERMLRELRGDRQ